MVEVGELAGVQGLVEPIMKLESRGGSWAFLTGGWALVEKSTW
jgi:hypothetical protein